MITLAAGNSGAARLSRSATRVAGRFIANLASYCRVDHVWDAAGMFATTRQARIAGVLAAYLADLALGDPKRGHPVALFGRAAATLERVTYRDGKVAGALHAGLMVAAATLL